MTASDGRRNGVGPALFGLIAAAVIAGVIVTVGVTPAIALTGVAAKNTISLFQDLPSDIAIKPLQQKTEIYAKSHGKNVQIASFYNQNREVITWDQVPQTVKNAAIAGEDVRFYEHGAVDPMGILRAIAADIVHSDAQGASTITQQYVKNVCVQEAELLSTQSAVDAAYNECVAPSIGRKIKEMRLAIALEKKYTKNEILLAYLNIALFGGQVYGIQSAARYYFGIDAKDLSAAQASSLIAIVNYPEALRLDDKSNWAANKARRDYILGVQRKQGMITLAQYNAAVATPIKTNITPSQSGCAQAGTAAYFCDYVTHVILNNSAFGATKAARAQNLQSAGWKIYTTLDLDAQKKASASLLNYVPKSAGNVAGAATSVEVGTGRILTMVQSKTYDQTSSAATKGANFTATSLNYNADQSYGGSAGFQTGSTYKAFTLIDWLKNGHGLYDVVNGSGRTFPASDFTYCGSAYTGASWSVSNDTSGEGGYQTVMAGTAASVNGVFATMGTKLDLCQIRDTAAAFGVHRADGTALQALAPTILGTNEIAPLTMAVAYAGISNDGTTCSSVAIDKVVQSNGKQLAVPKTSCKQSVSKPVAIAAKYALHGVMSGTAALANPYDGKWLIAKTGTTDDAKQTWIVGASSTTATAIWVGNVSGNANMRATYAGGYCRGTSVMSYKRYCLFSEIQGMLDSSYGGDTTGVTPDSKYLTGEQTEVPDVTGKTVAVATTTLEQAGFQVTVGASKASSQAKGTIGSQTPTGGTKSSSGTMVTIYPSTGSTSTASVPTVTGQTLSKAESALASAGFTALNVTYVQGTGACTVQSQSPSGGSTAATTTTIALTVSGAATATNGSYTCQ